MISEQEFNRRLAILKTEVDLDFPGLVPGLERGLQVVAVTESFSEMNLHPDSLRRLGGMVILCKRYGAAIVFVNENQFCELNSNKGPQDPKQ